MNSVSYNIFKKLISKNKNVLGKKVCNKWEWSNGSDLINRFNECKSLLKYNKFKKNDRLVYKGKNSLDFIAWNLAVNSEGGIWVPVYHNQNEEYLNYILENCSPSLFISDDNTVNKKVLSLRSSDKIGNYYNNENFEYNDISTLIYTSGTTGSPKGVMLSDENILSNIEGIRSRFKEFDGKDLRSLNILPWAHIYSITTELYYGLLSGNEIALCSSPDNFVRELYEVKPNVLYLVPKVLDLIKSKLSKLDYGIFKFMIPIILKKLFGSEFITIFVGGAKLDESTFNFYKYNGINICLGYGCSETSPMVSVNHLKSPRNEMSVGKLLDDIIVEIIDKEIHVAGPNVMKGYWNDVESTSKVLVERDGKIFYKTGDSGKVINNYLFLEGRISENYKLSNGKFVNVDDLESKIRENISGNFIVYGENRNYNILITDIKMEKGKLMKKCNNNLDGYLKVKDILYLENEIFIKYLTPKMSIKRKKIIKDYEKDISNLFT